MPDYLARPQQALCAHLLNVSEQCEKHSEVLTLANGEKSLDYGTTSASFPKNSSKK
jgi:hypothetical protein